MPFMDRLDTFTAHLEALADCGVGAARLSDEVAAATTAWRSEVEADVRRLLTTVAALSARHEAEQERAMSQGMAVEALRQASVAQALRAAAAAAAARVEAPDRF
jgi:hypothetical protein